MDIKEFIREQRDSMIENLIALVNIPTVYEEGAVGMPFGRPVAEGLAATLELGKTLGMQVRNVDGYAGEITAGTGNRKIGVLVHVDVVPPGPGWETEPFQCQLKDGKLFGRGTMDDKGPIIASLYAMKYLMSSGRIPEDSSVRMIIGTDEEEEWRGINYYKEHEKDLPEYSIVPDGYFPLIFCEKGLVDFDMDYGTSGNGQAEIQIEELYGGSGRNIVPGNAHCRLRTTPEQVEFIRAQASTVCGIETREWEKGLEVIVRGKSVHAMTPEKGLNAISLLIGFLGKLGDRVSHSEFISKYNRYIGMDYNGGLFGCGFCDELSGKLTFNIGILQLKEEGFHIEANLRYPASMEWSAVKEAMMKTITQAQFTYREKAYLPPVCIEPEEPFVKKLMAAYREVTGDLENQPFAIGGATYARGIPNAVAFGPLFPYEEELAHEANEFLSVDSLEKMTEIFAVALERLLEKE